VGVWKGAALLKWYAGDQLVGEESLSFGVEYPNLPEGEPMPDADRRRLVTLQLVCDRARRQYGVPPRKVSISTDEGDIQPVSIGAHWRAGSADFCHGSGILRVSPPPPEYRMTDLLSGTFGPG